jgi:hypothetical protein
MQTIGVDTHQATLAACAIDELGSAVAEASFANDPGGHRAFIVWAALIAPGGTVGIEGSSSFGAPLARFVQAAGLEVPGNRRLNRAFYVVAIAQSRWHPPARAYVMRRVEIDGKSWREAIQALKRRLVRPVYHLLVQGSLEAQMTP